jgi:hypothetical protein
MSGGMFEIAIATLGSCRWRVSSDSWIVPASGPTGTGPATIQYLVQPSTSTRSGSVTVEGLDASPVSTTTVNVSQTVDQPPQANFTVSPNPCFIVSGVQGDPNGSSVLNCTFNASSSTPSNLVSYEWTVGNVTVTENDPTISSFPIGCGFGGGQFNANVSLVVRDSSGRSGSATVSVSFIKDSGCL